MFYIEPKILMLCGVLIVEFTMIGGVADFDLSIFNPFKNYKRWSLLSKPKINFITIALNVICTPFALLYWIYKLFRIINKI